jgi:hypothetical protein
MPPISEYERTLIELLFDIGPVQPAGMGGHMAISEADIGWYRLNRRCLLTTAECAALRTLSRVYAHALGESTDPHMGAPWLPAQIDRDKVADGWAKWAEQMKSFKK